MSISQVNGYLEARTSTGSKSKMLCVPFTRLLRVINSQSRFRSASRRSPWNGMRIARPPLYRERGQSAPWPPSAVDQGCSAHVWQQDVAHKACLVLPDYSG